MQFVNRLNQIGQGFSLTRRSPVARRSRRRFLELETFEGRTLLSTLFVSTTGSYGIDPAYTSIQPAVNAAKPGDTIEVAAGTYSGSIVVNKSLTLLGAQENVNPTVAGARTNPAYESVLNGSFAIEASNVTINGFTVQNAKAATGVTDAAGDSNALLEYNVIQQASLGVSFVGDSNATISTNRIENAAGDGIDLGDESGDLAEYNLIESNGFTTAGGQESQGQGMLLSTVTNTKVLDNMVISNHTDGIELAISSTGVTVNDNTVNNNGGQGIAVGASSGNWVQWNTLSGNGVGIALLQSNGNDVDDNQVANSVGDGIDVGDDGGTESFHNEFSYNTITGSGKGGQGQGMLFSTDSWDVVYDNTVTGNHTDGIELAISSSHVLVSANPISDNGGDGIAVGATSSSVIEYNTLSGNGDGIHLEDSTGNTIYDNTSSNNLLDGIWLDVNSTGNTVTDNTMSGNGHFDAEDDSVGDLTAGTANTWSGNHGKTDNHGGGLLH